MMKKHRSLKIVGWEGNEYIRVKDHETIKEGAITYGDNKSICYQIMKGGRAIGKTPNDFGDQLFYNLVE